MNMEEVACAAATAVFNNISIYRTRLMIYLSACKLISPQRILRSLGVTNCLDRVVTFYYDLWEFTELVTLFREGLVLETMPILEMSLCWDYFTKYNHLQRSWVAVRSSSRSWIPVKLSGLVSDLVFWSQLSSLYMTNKQENITFHLQNHSPLASCTSAKDTYSKTLQENLVDTELMLPPRETRSLTVKSLLMFRTLRIYRMRARCNAAKMGLTRFKNKSKLIALSQMYSWREQYVDLQGFSVCLSACRRTL
jgi:hypothetical protein